MACLLCNLYTAIIILPNPWAAIRYPVSLKMDCSNTWLLSLRSITILCGSSVYGDLYSCKQGQKLHLACFHGLFFSTNMKRIFFCWTDCTHCLRLTHWKVPYLSRIYMKHNTWCVNNLSQKSNFPDINYLSVKLRQPCYYVGDLCPHIRATMPYMQLSAQCEGSGAGQFKVNVVVWIPEWQRKQLIPMCMKTRACSGQVVVTSVMLNWTVIILLEILILSL